jgi:hypothetical protein
MTRDLSEALRNAIDALADLRNEALFAGDPNLMRQVDAARVELVKRLVNDEQRRALA